MSAGAPSASDAIGLSRGESRTSFAVPGQRQGSFPDAGPGDCWSAEMLARVLQLRRRLGVGDTGAGRGACRAEPYGCATIGLRGPLSRLTPNRSSPVETQAQLEVGGEKLVRSNGFE